MNTMAFQYWTPRMSQDFGEAIVKARHTFQTSPLFSDEALADLIDRHPRELSDFCMITRDDSGAEYLPAGEVGDLSGKALIAAARSGKLWVNLRRAMNIHPEYLELVDSAFKELKRLAPRFRPTRFNGGLLISAPGARVPYHADKGEVILWHVRGRKRVFVYPNSAPHVRPEDLEANMVDDTRDDLPYRPELERAAATYDLEPGDMLSWPQYSPHRVENLEGLNVSVTTEWVSWRSNLSNRVYYANAVLRRRFGMTPSADNSLPVSLMKAGLGYAFKAAGMGEGLSRPVGAEAGDLRPLLDGMEAAATA